MAISESERERRRQQCLKTKPWERSTGAKTERGKAIVSQNALKSGIYSSHELIRLLARWERDERELVRFEAIFQKMYDAYQESNTPPPQRWTELFSGQTREQLIELWRSL